MDIYSLAIAHIHIGVRSVRMSASAEDRYCANTMSLRRLRLGLRGSIAMATSLILILGITLI